MVRFSFVLTTNYIGRFQLHNELLSFAWRWINRSIDSSCVFGWIDNGRQPILPGGHSILCQIHFIAICAISLPLMEWKRRK